MPRWQLRKVYLSYNIFSNKKKQKKTCKTEKPTIMSIYKL